MSVAPPMYASWPIIAARFFGFEILNSVAETGARLLMKKGMWIEKRRQEDTVTLQNTQNLMKMLQNKLLVKSDETLPLTH